MNELKQMIIKILNEESNDTKMYYETRIIQFAKKNSLPTNF